MARDSGDSQSGVALRLPPHSKSLTFGQRARRSACSAAALLLAVLSFTSAAAAEPATPSADPGRQLTALEAKMKQALDTYRLPSEYRKQCADNQQHDRAISFFRDLVAAQPDQWRARLELSCAYVDKIPTCRGVAAVVSQGALARKALDQADAVVAKIPDQWVGYYVRGLNHLHWPRAFRHADDAVNDLAKCAELQEKHGGHGGKPYYARVHLALGDACAKAGRFKEARQAWERGRKAFPDSKELRARLAITDDKELLKHVESQRSLEKPVDTSLSFLDAEKNR